MKRLTIAMVLLAQSLSIHAEEHETVLRFSGSTASYASVKPDGGLEVQKVWDGYRLVKRADGNCYRIEHTNLRIENVGVGQRAQFDESVTAVSCH